MPYLGKISGQTDISRALESVVISEKHWICIELIDLRIKNGS